jgi:hypothetical protein
MLFECFTLALLIEANWQKIASFRWENVDLIHI